MHNEKRIALILSAALFIALIIIVVLLLERPSAQPQTGNTSTVISPPTSPDGLMHSLSGQVTAVQAGVLTLSAVLPGKTIPSNVTVTAASNATIMLLTQKDPAEVAKEMAAYQKQFAGTSTANGIVSPPSPVTSQNISLADIKVGMSITVTPVANTTEGATNIVAQNISTYSTPAIPTN